MKKINQKSKTLLLIIAFFFTFSFGYSQIGIPGGSGNDDVGDEAPISSLVLLGMVAGAIVGLKKLK